MAVINNSKYIMLLRGNKGKGREKGKMKKTEQKVFSCRNKIKNQYVLCKRT